MRHLLNVARCDKLPVGSIGSFDFAFDRSGSQTAV